MHFKALVAFASGFSIYASDGSLRPWAPLIGAVEDSVALVLCFGWARELKVRRSIGRLGTMVAPILIWRNHITSLTTPI